MLCLERQALVDRKAAGSLFTREILGREEAESKEPKIRGLKKLCVCICVCVCVCVCVLMLDQRALPIPKCHLVGQ